MILKTQILNSADEEVAVTVDFVCHKEQRGIRDKYGAQETPDEPAEIEILSVVTEDTNEDITELLTKAQFQEIENQCWDSLNDYNKL